MRSFMAWLADVLAAAVGVTALILAFWGDDLSGGTRAVCAAVGALIVWRNLVRPFT